MALDARHRASIYQKLVPLLGDDDTNALITQYPSIEADELVTKQFLRAELSSLETRLTLRLGTALAAQTTLLLGAMSLLR